MYKYVPSPAQSGSSITSSVLEEWLNDAGPDDDDDDITIGASSADGFGSGMLSDVEFHNAGEDKQQVAETRYPFTLVSARKPGFLNEINTSAECSDLKCENNVVHFPSVSKLVRQFNVARKMEQEEKWEFRSRAEFGRKKRSKSNTTLSRTHRPRCNGIERDILKNKNNAKEMAETKEDNSSPCDSEDLMHGDKSDVNVICCSKEWSGEVFYELYVYGIVGDEAVEEFRTIDQESDRLLKLCEILAEISQEQARNLIVKSKTVADFIQGIFVHRTDGEMAMPEKEVIQQETNVQKISENSSSVAPPSESILNSVEGINAPGLKKEKTSYYKCKVTTSAKQKKAKTPQNILPSVRDKQTKTHVYFSDEASVVKDLSKATGIAVRYNIPVSEDPVIPEIVVTKKDMTPTPGITAMLNVKDEGIPTVKTFEKTLLSESISVNNSENKLKEITAENIIFSDLSNKPVQRTQSFPICNSEKRGRKKKGTRVSFCSLPPTEFEVESNPNAKPIESISRKPDQEDISSDDLHGKKVEDDTEEENSNEKSTFNAAAEIDEINEMLMDFLEEIEAESITVKDCIKAASKLKIITKEQAYDVLPSFKTRTTKDLNNNQSSTASDSSLTSDSSNEYNDQITSSELHSQSNTSADLQDDVFEEDQSADKLYDLLASLSLNDLSKCREKTLGRLCHLSTYEAYENMQKNAKLSALYKEDLEEGSDNCFGEESYNNYVEEWQLSPVEPNQFYMSESDASDASTCEYDAIVETKPTTKVPTAYQLCRIKNILPILKDEGVLEARQLWALRETSDVTSQARILASEMSKPKTSKSFHLLLEKMPELKWVSNILSNPSIQPPTPYPRRKHSQSFRTSTSSSTISDQPTLFKTSTPRRTVSLPRSQRKPPTCTGSNEQDKADDLSNWCIQNHIQEKTLHALRLHGYNDLNEVFNATEDDLEELSGINWMEKAKLWFSIRNKIPYNNCNNNENTFVDFFTNV